MKERDWYSESDDAELARLVGRGMNPILIAEAMGLSISTIRQQMHLLGLGAQPLPKERNDLPRAKPNPMAVARSWLGNRLVERPSGYFLDGSPANLDAIMLATNRLLKAHGIEQITASERWRV